VLAAVCLAALLFASTRRTGWVVLLAAVGAFVLAQALVLRRGQLLAVVGAVVLALAAAAASPVVQKRVQDVAVDLQKYQAAAPKDQGQVDVSSGIRLRMWQISLELMKERPLVGTSFGAFPSEYKRIDNARGGSLVEGFNPHNEYVQMGAMFGLVGLLLYLSLYAALLQSAWQWRGSTQGTLVLVCTAALASSVLMNSMLIDMMEGHLFALLLAALAFTRWPTAAGTAPGGRAA
jgi:O-antigen ligase